MKKYTFEGWGTRLNRCDFLRDTFMPNQSIKKLNGRINRYIAGH